MCGSEGGGGRSASVSASFCIFFLLRFVFSPGGGSVCRNAEAVECLWMPRSRIFNKVVEGGYVRKTLCTWNWSGWVGGWVREFAIGTQRFV